MRHVGNMVKDIIFLSTFQASITGNIFSTALSGLDIIFIN